MEGQPDRDTFLGIFYEHYVHWLVEPFWLGDLSEGVLCYGNRTYRSFWGPLLYGTEFLAFIICFIDVFL